MDVCPHLSVLSDEDRALQWANVPCTPYTQVSVLQRTNRPIEGSEV